MLISTYFYILSPPLLREDKNASCILIYMALFIHRRGQKSYFKNCRQFYSYYFSLLKMALPITPGYLMLQIVELLYQLLYDIYQCLLEFLVLLEIAFPNWYTVSNLWLLVMLSIDFLLPLLPLKKQEQQQQLLLLLRLLLVLRPQQMQFLLLLLLVLLYRHSDFSASSLQYFYRNDYLLLLPPIIPAGT